MRTQNIPYLSFLSKNIEKNIFFTNNGCILVNVPNIYNYVIHKSYSYLNRNEQGKKNKDIRQIEGLLRIMNNNSSIGFLIDVYNKSPKTLQLSFKKTLNNLKNNLQEQSDLSLFILDLIEIEDEKIKLKKSLNFK